MRKIYFFFEIGNNRNPPITDKIQLYYVVQITQCTLSFYIYLLWLGFHCFLVEISTNILRAVKHIEQMVLYISNHTNHQLLFWLYCHLDSIVILIPLSFCFHCPFAYWIYCHFDSTVLFIPSIFLFFVLEIENSWGGNFNEL